MKKQAAVLLLAVQAVLAPCIMPLFAENNKFAVPDSSYIRKGAVETWFMAPLDMLRSKNSEIRKNEAGQEFQIRLEEQDATFAVYVAPERKLSVDVYTEDGVHTEVQKVYPGDVTGSWALIRDKQTGEPKSIRYYFCADSDVYIQFRPSVRRTAADFVIFNNYASHSLMLEIPFERFYSASFTDIYKWTEKIFPWHILNIQPDMYYGAQQMIGVIRNALPGIVYAEDAMYDENSRPVYISDGKPRTIEEKNIGKLSLSSAGFVKWVVDGLIIPVAGGCTKRTPLLVPTVTYKDTGFLGAVSRQYDLSFSLDWTRNLAAALFSVHSGRTYLYPESGVDVKITPFSAAVAGEEYSNEPGYIKDVGYTAGSLTGILYVLAVTNPEYFYLAAVRQSDKKTPEVHLFNQCAVLFPYFDKDGRFQCTVFENGTEQKLRAFVNRYRNDFIHLVRVQSSDRFFPLQVK